MKKILLLTVFLMSLVVSALAQTSPRQITVLADFSDRNQFAVENRLFSALETLGQSTLLEGLQIKKSPLVINTGQADGASLLKAWNLDSADLPLLALTTIEDEGTHSGLLWHWKVDSVPEAIRALEAELGIASTAAHPVIRAADFNPKTGPLSAGAIVTVTLQGTEGCSGKFDLGGAVGLPLFEVESGLYRGDYQVKPDDRTDAAVTVHLTSDGGASVSKHLGQILLQGLQAPHLQAARQISTGEWLLTGTAPPNSFVSVDAVIKQTFIFKFKSKNGFRGTADAQGQFQLTAYIEDDVAGSEATFTTTATVGGASQTSVQKMVFQGLPRAYIPPTQTPTFSPWTLAGGWYHGNRSTSIRVNGRDSVVIQNEFGQQTVLYLVGSNRLESRGSYRLTGRVNGPTIFWDNGTRWTRSR